MASASSGNGTTAFGLEEAVQYGRGVATHALRSSVQWLRWWCKCGASSDKSAAPQSAAMDYVRAVAHEAVHMADAMVTTPAAHNRTQADFLRSQTSDPAALARAFTLAMLKFGAATFILVCLLYVVFCIRHWVHRTRYGRTTTYTSGQSEMPSVVREAGNEKEHNGRRPQKLSHPTPVSFLSIGPSIANKKSPVNHMSASAELVPVANATLPSWSPVRKKTARKPRAKVKSPTHPKSVKTKTTAATTSAPKTTNGGGKKKRKGSVEKEALDDRSDPTQASSRSWQDPPLPKSAPPPPTAATTTATGTKSTQGTATTTTTKTITSTSVSTTGSSNAASTGGVTDRTQGSPAGALSPNCSSATNSIRLHPTDEIGKLPEGSLTPYSSSEKLSDQKPSGTKSILDKTEPPKAKARTPDSNKTGGEVLTKAAQILASEAGTLAGNGEKGPPSRHSTPPRPPDDSEKERKGAGMDCLVAEACDSLVSSVSCDCADCLQQDRGSGKESEASLPSILGDLQALLPQHRVAPPHSAHASPSTSAASASSSGCAECQSRTLRPVVFRWHDATAQCVYVTGSFLGWQSKIQMHRVDSPYAHANGLDRDFEGVAKKGFVLELRLPRGHHEFKYIVDRHWAIDEQRQPTIRTRDGHLHHVLHV